MEAEQTEQKTVHETETQPGLGDEYEQAEEGPTSSFENVFPSEKLKNGWSVALRFMSVGYDKIKQSTIEGVEYVNNTQAMGAIRQQITTINNSEAMQSIKATTSETSAKIRQSTGPIVQKAKDGFEVMLEGVSKMGESIVETTSTGMQNMQPAMEQAGQTIRRGWETVSTRTVESWESARQGVSGEGAPSAMNV